MPPTLLSSLARGLESAQAEGGVTVDLDGSLLVQIALFVVLLLVLKPVLFEPMLKLFEEREKRTEGTKAKARKEDKKSVEALKTYETALSKARSEGGALRDALRADGQKKEAQILAEARAHATKTLDDGRRALAAEVSEARSRLSLDSQGLARELAARVLGREVG